MKDLPTTNRPVIQLVEYTTCIECGVLFSLPATMYRARLKDGDPFYCPNGHEQWFLTDSDKGKSDGPSTAQLQAEIARLKGELVDARHAQEVAEARLAGGKDGSASSTVLVLDGRGRMACPHCGALYSQPGAFQKHLRNIHNDQVTLDMLLHRQAAAEQAGAVSRTHQVEGG